MLWWLFSEWPFVRRPFSWWLAFCPGFVATVTELVYLFWHRPNVHFITVILICIQCTYIAAVADKRRSCFI